MDWVLIIFAVFKALVFVTGMFYAIKWHYDKGQKKGLRSVLIIGVQVAAVFLLVLLCLGYGAYVLATKLGLNLSYP